MHLTLNKHLTAILLLPALLLAVVIYHFASRGAAPTDEQTAAFGEATALLQANDPRAAAERFETLVDSGQTSVAALYNLALSQHQSGDLGRAIYNYERAARLDPAANDIATNLARARADAAAIETEPGGWLALATVPSARWWAILGATALLGMTSLSVAGALGKPLLAKRPTIAFSVAMACGLALCASALVTLDQHHAGRGVILQADTPLRVSPFENAKAVATLPAGRTVRVLEEQNHDGYQLVGLAAGRSGWVQREQIGILTAL